MVTINHNLHISSIDAYIDPIKPVDKAIITHAHADHAKPYHKKVLASEDTINIMKLRYGDNCAEEFQILKYGEKINVNGIFISLHPAGHILGSSQILLENKGYKTLITGDYKTIKDQSSQEFCLVKSHSIITEATFGLPIFKHPNPNDEIKKLLLSLNFNNNQSHLVGCYSLGKAQEAHAILTGAGISTVSHPAVAKMTTACRNAGCPLSTPLIFEDTIPPNHVLICPPKVVRSEQFRSIPNLRTAMLSGWALKKSATYRFGVDAAFPLSDHADFPGLLEAVQRVNPKRVITVHGYTREFAAELRRRNYEARSASGGDQLEFDLPR